MQQPKTLNVSTKEEKKREVKHSTPLNDNIIFLFYWAFDIPVALLDVVTRDAPTTDEPFSRPYSLT